jgi:hypothetical protein
MCTVLCHPFTSKDDEVLSVERAGVTPGARVELRLDEEAEHPDEHQGGADDEAEELRGRPRPVAGARGRAGLTG